MEAITVVFGDGSASYEAAGERHGIARLVDAFYRYMDQLPIAAEDVGGEWARRVRYFAESGRVMIQRLQTQETNQVVNEERALERRLSVAPPRGEVDLFD